MIRPKGHRAEVRNPELERWDSWSKIPSSEAGIIPISQMRKLRLSEVGTSLGKSLPVGVFFSF